MLSLLTGRTNTPQPQRLALPSPEQAAAIKAVTTDLTTKGATPEFATALIATASTHGSIFGGDLRTAAETEVARRIVAAPPLPVTGAAIAFVGAGGSGKTSCTAALASAYARHGSLPVTVIAVDAPDDGQSLKRMLAEEPIEVQALNSVRAQRAISTGRDGGIVVVDTAAINPADEQAVAALATALEQLELDAVYVTLPATLSNEAARRAIESLQPLTPAAAAITHADETDQLAVVVETAISQHVPLAYVHSGADHRTALSAISAADLAQRLLPQTHDD